MSKAYEVFVSYSRDDKDRVRPWVTRMREGGAEVFFDTDSLVGGEGWREAIVDAIASSKAVIFVASRTAFDSEYVPKELALAEQAKKKILPVYLEKTQASKKAAFILADLHRIDAFGRSDEEIWGEIERALREAGVVLKAKAPEAPDPSAGGAESRKKRKRDDAYLEWEPITAQIEMDGESAQNVRRSKAREDRPMIEPDVAAGSTSPIIEIPDEPVLAEVEGRGMADPPPPGWEARAGDAVRDEWRDSEIGGEMEHTRGRGLLFGAIGVLLGAIFAGWRFFSPSSPPEPEIVEPLPVVVPSSIQVAVPVPAPIPETLTEAAIGMVKQYYEASLARGTVAQADLLSDPVEDYFGTKSRPLAEVRKELADYAKTWPKQTFEIVGPVAAVERAGQGRVDCEAQVRYVTENDVVRTSGILRGRFSVSFEQGQKIVSVIEVPGSRKPDPVTHFAAGQARRAIEFVRTAILSGNSNPGTTAKIISEMFAPKVASYYGEKKTRAEIEEDTKKHQTSWTTRTYEIVSEPAVTGGLGTGLVTVEAGIHYRASRGDGKGANGRSGTLRARYDLEFHGGPSPLIVGVEELDRTAEP